MLPIKLPNRADLPLELHALPDLSGTSAVSIPWVSVCQHLDHIARCWNGRVSKLLDIRQAQERHNQNSKALRIEHRDIMRTQGAAAARRHQHAYAEYDSWLFLNIDDDSHLDSAFLDSRPEAKINEGIVRFFKGSHKAACFCKNRRSPLLIAAHLGQMRSFAERFSPTEASIAGSAPWVEIEGTITEWFYGPYRQDLRETAHHLLSIIERLHLGAAMVAVLGTGGSDAIMGAQRSPPELETTRRTLDTLNETRPADDSSVVTVLQEVFHCEPAAVIDQEVAEFQVQTEADDQFAYLVERRIQASEMQQAQSEKVHLLSFRAGQGELFRKMLLEDKEFKPLRLSLQDAGCPLTLRPSGTVVLVKPSQYFGVMSALGKRKLKRYELLITESVEYLMDQVLTRMASKSRPRERRGERVEFDVDVCQFVIRRSFICQAPQILKSDTVTQSTTEALRSGSSSSHGYWAHRRGINPRRCLSASWHV